MKTALAIILIIILLAVFIQFYFIFKERNQLKEKFRIVYYKWIPREQNFEADNLSRKAYLEI